MLRSMHVLALRPWYAAQHSTETDKHAFAGAFGGCVVLLLYTLPFSYSYLALRDAVLRTTTSPHPGEKRPGEKCTKKGTKKKTGLLTAHRRMRRKKARKHLSPGKMRAQNNARSEVSTHIDCGERSGHEIKT